MILYVPRHVVRVNKYLICHESITLDVENPDINKFCTATDSTAYLAPYPGTNQWTSLIGSEIGMYTATEKRPDFKLICKRFLPKCACLRGSAPDPAGGITAPPDPQLEKVGFTQQSVPPTFVSGSTPLITGCVHYWVRYTYSEAWL